MKSLPALYMTRDALIIDKIIHQHYFIGGSDWYMAEYCPKERMFFNYAVLNSDYQNAEWGYTSFDDLDRFKVRGIHVDRDLHWKPIRFIDIPGIKKGYAYDWER